jgi:hypothetical protein
MTENQKFLYAAASMVRDYYRMGQVVFYMDEYGRSVKGDEWQPNGTISAEGAISLVCSAIPGEASTWRYHEIMSIIRHYLVTYLGVPSHRGLLTWSSNKSAEQVAQLFEDVANRLSAR